MAKVHAGNLVFEIYPDGAEKYRWRAKARNHKIVATSNESFHSEANATRAVIKFIERTRS